MSLACPPASDIHTAAAISQERLGLQPALIQPTRPEKGVFLVARREMPDLRFRESVILILDHGSDGTLGLIINRTTTILLTDALPRFKSIDKAQRFLFFGGPVAVGSILFLIHSIVPLEPAKHIVDNVYWSGSSVLLKQLLHAGKSEDELRLYLGYAGWSPGQLAAEINEGSWQLFRANPESIFSQEPDSLWQRLMEQRLPGGIMASNRCPVISRASFQ